MLAEQGGDAATGVLALIRFVSSNALAQSRSTVADNSLHYGTSEITPPATSRKARLALDHGIDYSGSCNG